jgi:tRNA1(Val) A37 N6-methylase TrmN6
MLLLNLEKERSISSKLRISNYEVKNLVLSFQRYNLIESGIKENMLPRILSRVFKHFSRKELFKTGIIELDPIDEFIIGNFLMKLVNIQENDRILDPACGMGNLLASGEKIGEIYGIEKLYTRAELAKINLYLAGISNLTIYWADIYRLDPEKHFNIKNKGKFNIIITNPPTGKRFIINPTDFSSQDIENSAFMNSGKSYKEEELFLLEKCLTLINNNGKIAIFLPNKILFGTPYKNFREYIAKKYKINAVISIIPTLPYMSILFLTNEKVEDYLNQQIFFARVEKNTNDENWLEKELSQIVKQYEVFSTSKNKEQKFPKNIIISKLHDDFRLDYTYYKALESVIDNKYEVQSLKHLAEIQIGMKISNININNNNNNNKTEVFVIKGQNIKEYAVIPNYDNKIKMDLKLNYKHLINYEDIVMTRSGNPDNIGIFLLDDNQYVSSDNVIIIRPKKEKVIPYYLLCYFISRNGQKDLETRIIKGTVIRSISVQSLSNLEIPLPPKHIQESIGNKFRRYLTLRENKRLLEEQLFETKETIDSDISHFYKKGGNKND